MYFIQHCFIRRPSDFTVSEDAGIELLLLRHWQSDAPTNHSARSHPHSARSHPHSAIDLIHARLDLIHTRPDLIHARLYRSHPCSARSHPCSVNNTVDSPFQTQKLRCLDDGKNNDGGKTESGQKMSSTGTNAPNFLSAAAQCLFTCSSPCFSL
jgi:hypothetical protein